MTSYLDIVQYVSFMNYQQSYLQLIRSSNYHKYSNKSQGIIY